jgi:hypothetical protein
MRTLRFDDSRGYALFQLLYQAATLSSLRPTVAQLGTVLEKNQGVKG